MRLKMGHLGFVCSRCRGRGPHLELRLELSVPLKGRTWTPWESSGESTGEYGVHVSCEPSMSALLSSRKSSVRLSVRLTIGWVAFSRGATGLSHLPSSLESVLTVTVESVQGIQVCLEFTGNRGIF